MEKAIILKVNSEEVKRIGQSDARLGQLISFIGDLTIPLRDNRFEALVKSIIGQQLSVKAAETIYTRVEALCKRVTPESIILMEETELRAAGLSKPKISYVKDLAEKVMSKEVDLYHLDQFGNDTIIRLMTPIKGVGKWTAEMFLLFTLGRMDVLSLGDVGLQRSAKWLYNLDKQEDGKKCLEKKASLWFPYYTVASLYLWEAVNKGYVDSFESLEEISMDGTSVIN
ncbi:DNA-3-methyladenine glycosylase [Ammoniphilus sp. YIM 78166]|uniref:DNA-3-methyladenine glycosylase family protein n=1 Tax=Ammoniphilus sp. YIM 78166 TaxID=1644106 RepID=UPI001F0D14A1|nr:DNA-3-methyladenine glycosylase [Ammoniphilus sp. YIM 78166]